MYSSSVDNSVKVDDLVKVGVFFCTCGHIMNDYFDMKALRKFTGMIPGVSYVDENSTLCTGSGLDWLRTKIARSGCNRVVIAGCSPYGYESDFMNVLEEAGLNRYFLAIADLREGCAWVGQEKGDLEPRARQLLRSAVRRVSLAKPVEKVQVRVNPSTLVIGAGLAGVQMALELHRMGIKPILIEQSPQAGLKNPAFLSPYTQGLDEREMFEASVKELQDKKIELLTSTAVKEVTGGAGAFRVTLDTASEGNAQDREKLPGQARFLEVGSIVVSTDFQSLTGESAAAFRSSPRIVGLSRLQEMIEADRKSLDRIMITADKRTKYACFILGESEAFTKTATIMALNEAIALKEQFKAEVLVIAREVTVSGTEMSALYRLAREVGILFCRYTEDCPPEVSVEKGVIAVSVQDPFLAGNGKEKGRRTISVCADLLVFEDKILPGEGTEALKDILRVNLNEGGFYQEKNIHLKPNLSNKKGIFFAGSCHGERDIYETFNDVRSVAMSVYSSLSREYLEVEQKVVINTDKCALCLTCIRSCPHRAIEVGEVEAGQKRGARIMVEACQGCGVCAGECPAKAIEMVHYSDNQIFSELTFER